jgi:hypothetical protein
MQNWRPWDAVSKADWGLAVEREAVIRLCSAKTPFKCIAE